MPSSCADMERMGQKVNGFFSVKGLNKMEMIYCNFFANQNGTTCAIFACYCLSKYFCLQTNRNGSDIPTSNRRPSISTSRKILTSTQLELRFRSIWRGWTKETPWIWHRGYSRHRGREFIFSLSRELRIFFLHLLMLGFILFFIWTDIEWGRVLLTRETAPFIKGIRWPSSRRWTCKKAMKSGCRLFILVQTRIWLTTVTTTPISRVSCWRRKLWRPFEVQLHRRHETFSNIFVFLLFFFKIFLSTWNFGEEGKY